MAYLILEACNGCSACARQCPTAAISGEEDVHYEIDAGACIDCGVCGQVCPVDAVLDDAGRVAQPVPKDRRARPRLRLDLCNGCGMCVDRCPFDCLQILGRRHFGVAQLHRPLACVSCSECVDACIKGALQMKPCDLRSIDIEAESQSLQAYLLRTQGLTG